MLIIPAIDLKDHQVVRLSQGKMGQAKVYADNPLLVAEDWIKKGARRLHLVDLNGAFEGKPIHFKEIREIAEAFPEIEIQVGGGLRTLETIIQYFECGVSYSVLGTTAIKNPELILQACKQYPQRIILGVDAKGGQVALEGWGEVSVMKPVDLVLKFKKEALAEVIFTDVSKDGMMQGMNFESIRNLASASPFGIIASGGLTSLEDIKELKKIPNVTGVIVGKALYEGLFQLEEAIKVGG